MRASCSLYTHDGVHSAIMHCGFHAYNIFFDLVSYSAPGPDAP